MKCQITITSLELTISQLMPPKTISLSRKLVQPRIEQNSIGHIKDLSACMIFSLRLAYRLKQFYENETSKYFSFI